RRRRGTGALRRPLAPEAQQGRAQCHPRLRHTASGLFPPGTRHRAAELPRPHHRVWHPLVAGSAQAVTSDSSNDGAGFRAAPDLQNALGQWLSWLRHERRVADLTAEAYARDAGQLLWFLNEHHGEPTRLQTLTNLSRADFRAWMAARQAQGIEARSQARSLSAIKSLFRFLAKQDLAANGVISTLRAPK